MRTHPSFFGLLASIIAAALHASALALECPQMPKQAQQDLDAEVRVAVGKIGAASGVELTTRTQRFTTDLLGKLPRADKVYLEQMMFASYCSAVRDNPAIAESERESRVKAYVTQLRSTLGTATREAKPPATDPRDAARHALERIPVEYGTAAFLKSIQDGRADIVDLFLQAGIDPNSEDHDASALTYAATLEKPKIAEALLRAKATVTGQAVSWAAMSGRVDTLRLFLMSGVDQPLIDRAFQAAASGGQLEALKLLGGRISDRRQLASQALPEAARRGGDEERRLAVVRELLAMGADANAQDEKGEKGWSALAHAADNGHASVVAALIAAHARPDDVCACRGYLDGGYSPLIMAAYRGHVDVASSLIAAGAAVNARTQEGMTALMWAARGNADAQLLLRLLDAGADPNLRDAKSNTALIYSVHSVESMRTLIGHGADVNAQSNDGATALMTAAAGDHVESVRYALAAGAELHARSRFGRTALMVAVRNGAAASVRLLIAHGGKVNDKDVDGKSVLVHANELDADETRTSIIATLTQAGAK